jgi:hypothetical protein
VTALLLNCVCMMLAQFTEMIGILLNNSRNILFRSAVVNVSALLMLLFKICVNIVSSLHVATVETERRLPAVFSCNDLRQSCVFLPFLRFICGAQRVAVRGNYFV